MFTRESPSMRGGGGGEGTGKFYFDPSLTQYVGWFEAQPSAKVQGNLTYNGQTYQVQGSGYHDHNWGTADFNKMLDHWHWTGELSVTILLMRVCRLLRRSMIISNCLYFI
jgi:predicted secreted hydrolase